MGKNNLLDVQGTIIRVQSGLKGDFISLTDMIKAKDGDFFISDWLRNRNTVEFLGVWESVHNPSFNYGEYATIRNSAGLNNYRVSVKEWRNENPDLDGNIREHSSIEQLLILTNLESLNAEFIKMGLPQSERLILLHKTALSQMKSLLQCRSVNRIRIKEHNGIE